MKNKIKENIVPDQHEYRSRNRANHELERKGLDRVLQAIDAKPYEDEEQLERWDGLS